MAYRVYVQRLSVGLMTENATPRMFTPNTRYLPTYESHEPSNRSFWGGTAVSSRSCSFLETDPTIADRIGFPLLNQIAKPLSHSSLT